MSANRVVLIRHGLTDFNVERRFQGVIDRPLNDTGRGQAEAAARALNRQLDGGRVRLSFERVADFTGAVQVVSSPLQRARETAQILTRVLRMGGHEVAPLEVDPRFIERSYGVMEGLNLAEATERYESWVARWRSTGECLEAGIEGSDEVGARMAEAVRDWSGRLSEGTTLLVVSHGSAIVRGVITLIGLNPLNFDALSGLDNCRWSVLVHTGGGGSGASGEPTWRLAAHNQGSCS